LFIRDWIQHTKILTTLISEDKCRQKVSENQARRKQPSSDKAKIDSNFHTFIDHHRPLFFDNQIWLAARSLVAQQPYYRITEWITEFALIPFYAVFTVKSFEFRVINFIL
jgi:hypothetical protein